MAEAEVLAWADIVPDLISDQFSSVWYVRAISTLAYVNEEYFIFTGHTHSQ